MRIRTIKPSFWRSDDITALPMNLRLLFIGLWSYVDDNGVGINDCRQIAADLFALEEDQAAIRSFVREGVATLSRGPLVTCYMIEDKSYLFITKWDEHQKIDRPNKVRFPRPPDDFDPSTSRNGQDPDQGATPSRHPRDTLAVVVEEEGSKGVEEKTICGPAQNLTQDRTQHDHKSSGRPRGSRAVAEALNATAHSAEARGILRKWTAGQDEPLPPTTLTLLAKQIDTLRDRGATGAYVWAALLEWDEKRQIGDQPKPGLLPYLHDQIKLDGLSAGQLYATPVEYLRDEDIDVFEVLGYDSHPPEAPDEIENGPFDIRHDWYAAAIKQRHHERCIQAREVITRRQAMRQTARESA